MSGCNRNVNIQAAIGLPESGTQSSISEMEHRFLGGKWVKWWVEPINVQLLKPQDSFRLNCFRLFSLFVHEYIIFLNQNFWNCSTYLIVFFWNCLTVRHYQRSHDMGVKRLLVERCKLNSNLILCKLIFFIYKSFSKISIL